MESLHCKAVLLPVRFGHTAGCSPLVHSQMVLFFLGKITVFLLVESPFLLFQTTSFCCISHPHILIVHHFTFQMILTSPCFWGVHLFLLLKVMFKPSKSRKIPQKSPKIPTNPHLFPCQKSAKPTVLGVHQPPPVTKSGGLRLPLRIEVGRPQHVGRLAERQSLVAAALPISGRINMVNINC